MPGSDPGELAVRIVPEDDTNLSIVKHLVQGGGDLCYIHQSALAPVIAFTSANKPPNLP